MKNRAYNNDIQEVLKFHTPSPSERSEVDTASVGENHEVIFREIITKNKLKE